MEGRVFNKRRQNLMVLKILSLSNWQKILKSKYVLWEITSSMASLKKHGLQTNLRVFLSHFGQALKNISGSASEGYSISQNIFQGKLKDLYLRDLQVYFLFNEVNYSDIHRRLIKWQHKIKRGCWTSPWLYQQYAPWQNCRAKDRCDLSRQRNDSEARTKSSVGDAKSRLELFPGFGTHEETSNIYLVGFQAYCGSTTRV